MLMKHTCSLIAHVKTQLFTKSKCLRKNVSTMAYYYTRYGGDKTLVAHDLEIVTWLILPVAYACLKD